MAAKLLYQVTVNCFFFQFWWVQTFAGADERSSRNGTVLYLRFYTQPGIAVSDSSTGPIKLTTPLKRAADFLDALHSLTKAFSLHKKHASYSLKTIDEAEKLVEQCMSVIQKNVDHTRHDRNIGLINEPEGSVSAATIDSLHLLGFGLRHLKNNTEKFGYRDINFLSCMTLPLENLDSTVNKKHDTQTVLTIPQSFASFMKKSVKRLVEWVTYYCISVEIWYLLPENTMNLEELKFPKWNKNYRYYPCIPWRKKRNARVGIIKWCCCPIKKWKAGNYNFARKLILRRAQINHWWQQRIQWQPWRCKQNSTLCWWRSYYQEWEKW